MSYFRIFKLANMYLTLFAKIKFSRKIPDLQYHIYPLSKVAGLCHFVSSFFLSFRPALWRAPRRNNVKRKDEITKKRQAK